MNDTTRTERVAVIGAGPCGLSIARQLRHAHGVDALVLDRADAVASSWRTRYDGFRLNTCGFWSHLPGRRIPRGAGRWPSRDEMAAYFDDYARTQGLRLALGVSVMRVDRDADRWLVTAENDESYAAAAVVVATGNYRIPVLDPAPDAFGGEYLHAAQYRTPAAFAGRDVLVIGSGNSATDIALQLSDGVAGRVRMAVRTPPHLVPRSVAGIPVDAFSDLFAGLPVPVLDRAAAVMQRLRFGDLRAVGLPAPEQGIYTALRDDARIPTIADELVPRVQAGRIEIVCAVDRFTTDGVVLTDGSSLTTEVVIAATGYRQGLEPLVGHLGVLDDDGHPMVDGLPGAAPGLWFAGYSEPLVGPLRAFRRAASPIADDVAGYLRGTGRPRR